MNTKHTGGPAFPAPAGVSHYTEQGMTLRDYIAANAMMRFIDFGSMSDDEYYMEGATAAYKMADAMLKTREK